MLRFRRFAAVLFGQTDQSSSGEVGQKGLIEEGLELIGSQRYGFGQHAFKIPAALTKAVGSFLTLLYFLFLEKLLQAVFALPDFLLRQFYLFI